MRRAGAVYLEHLDGHVAGSLDRAFVKAYDTAEWAGDAKT